MIPTERKLKLTELNTLIRYLTDQLEAAKLMRQEVLDAGEIWIVEGWATDTPPGVQSPEEWDMLAGRNKIAAIKAMRTFLYKYNPEVTKLPILKDLVTWANTIRDGEPMGIHTLPFWNDECSENIEELVDEFIAIGVSLVANP